jgi:sortase B
MNDNNNELQSAEGSSSGSLSRAERIKAIKNSIHTDDSVAATAAEKKAAADNPPVEDWEKEIADRIAKRVKKVKADKDAALEQVLASEDNANASADATAADEISSADEPSTTEPELPDEQQEETIDEPEQVTQELSPTTEIPEAAATDAVPKKNKKSGKKKKTFTQKILGLLPQKQDKMSERIRKIVFLGSCVAIVVCGTMVISYYVDTIGTQNDYDTIETEYLDYKSLFAEDTTDDEGEVYTMFAWAERLMKQNQDLVGYITIPGSIDDSDAENMLAYPVVQSDDLEKYLTISFTGEEARAGSLFLDYRNHFDDVEDGKLVEENSDNLIIYGHNMQTGDMFGKLQNYKNDSSFYGEHPVINLDSKYKQYQYKIFAIFIVDAEDETETAFDCWNKINFADEDEFYDFVDEAKRRTIRLNDVDVKYGDKLLTLSTCNTIFGSDGPGRLIVMARLVRDGEDLYEGTQNSVENTNIKWPSLYYKYNKNEEYDPDADFVSYRDMAEEKTTDIGE